MWMKHKNQLIISAGLGIKIKFFIESSTIKNTAATALHHCYSFAIVIPFVLLLSQIQV